MRMVLKLQTEKITQNEKRSGAIRRYESEAARMGADGTHPRQRTQVASAVLPR